MPEPPEEFRQKDWIFYIFEPCRNDRPRPIPSDEPRESPTDEDRERVGEKLGGKQGGGGRQQLISGYLACIVLPFELMVVSLDTCRKVLEGVVINVVSAVYPKS